MHLMKQTLFIYSGEWGKRMTQHFLLSAEVKHFADGRKKYIMITLIPQIIKNITGRLFILYLDHVTSELQKQVLDCSSRFIALYLMPNKLHLLANEETVMALYDAYKVYLFDLEHFKAELQRWCEKWIDVSRDEQPNSILSTLQELTPASYPDLNVVCFCHPANQSLSRKKNIYGYCRQSRNGKIVLWTKVCSLGWFCCIYTRIILMGIRC